MQTFNNLYTQQFQIFFLKLYSKAVDFTKQFEKNISLLKSSYKTKKKKKNLYNIIMYIYLLYLIYYF